MVKKEKYFLVIAFLIVIFVILLCAGYFKLQKELSDVSLRVQNLSCEETSFKNESLPLQQINYYFSNNETSLFEIGGGGVITSVNHQWGIGKDCVSWGNASCINSLQYNGKLELSCPKGYVGEITGYYSSNPSSSENIQVFIICILEEIV